MDGNNLDKIGYKIIILFFFLFIILATINNYRYKKIKQNEIYTFGEITKVYYGKGNRSVDFKFTLFNDEYKTSSSVFTKNIKIEGSKYFVIVNKNNLEQAYILDCCPYDESKHFVPSEGLDKIPDAELQKKADEAFEEIFNSPLGRLLPPY